MTVSPMATVSGREVEVDVVGGLLQVIVRHDDPQDGMLPVRSVHC